MGRPRKPPKKTAERLRAEHRREHEEHLAWRADVEGWREEYVAAALEYLRSTCPELEIEGYEAALDAHEIAIDTHEEMLGRHERMLEAEARGGPVTSDEMAGFQSDIEDRHDRSREAHRRLETTHRAILKALRLKSSRSAG